MVSTQQFEVLLHNEPLNDRSDGPATRCAVVALSARSGIYERFFPPHTHGPHELSYS